MALHRVALHLRPHVPGAPRPARRGPHRAHPARHRARAEEPGAHRALHGGHRHRAARLPAPPLRQDRPRALPDLRGGGAERLGRPGGRRAPARPPGRAGPDLLPARAGGGPRAARPVHRPAPARVRPGEVGGHRAGPGRGDRAPRRGARRPGPGPPDRGARSRGGRPGQPAPHHRLPGDRARRGRGPGERGSARPRHRPGEPRLPLSVLRGGAGPAAAAALLVQPPLGACPECKGFGNVLRYDEARVVPGSDPEPGRGRGGALVASLGPLVPEAAPQGGQEARRGREPTVRGALRRGPAMGLRRRRRAHRHPRLLRGGGVVPLQAPRPRLPLALPEPVAVPALRGPAPAARGPRGPRGRRQHRRARRPDHRGPGRALRDAAALPLGGGGGARRAQDAAGQALLPAPGGPRLPHPRSADPDAVRRGGAADQSRQSARGPAHRHALRARRAVHRASRAGYRPAGRALPRARRGRQHGGDRRARSRADRGGRLRDRDGAGLGRARGRHGVRGHPGRVPQGSALADRALPERPRHDPPAARAPGRPPLPRARGRPREQPEGRHGADPAAHPDLRDRGVRLREVHARARHALPRGGPALQGGLRGRGRPRRAAGPAASQGRPPHRPGADRPHAPLQSGHVREGLRRDPAALRGPAARPGARAWAPAPSRSTCPAAAARRARATDSRSSRCTSSRTCT